MAHTMLRTINYLRYVRSFVNASPQARASKRPQDSGMRLTDNGRVRMMRLPTPPPGLSNFPAWCTASMRGSPSAITSPRSGQASVHLGGGPQGNGRPGTVLWRGEAALTGLVDRVERRGLAKRTPVEGDRRALHVTLTAAGQRGNRAGEVTGELEHLLSPLAPHDREHFRRAMAAIIAQCRAQASEIPADARARAGPCRRAGHAQGRRLATGGDHEQ